MTTENVMRVECRGKNSGRRHMDEGAPEKADQRENVGLSKDSVIRMDKKRSDRFFREMGDLGDAICSLESTIVTFPSIAVSRGEMNPAVAVAAFTSMMQRSMRLLYAMTNGEEHLVEDLREKQS